MILKSIRLVALALLLSSCEKLSDDAVLALNENQIVLMGHGGMGIFHQYPLDSDLSLNKCLEVGAHGVEIDVQMTADGVLMAYHNLELEDETQCEGQIHLLNFNDLKNCQYKRIFPNKGQLVHLNSWITAAEIDYNQTKYYTLDCKLLGSGEDYVSQFAKSVFDLVSQPNLVSRIQVESSNVQFLKLLQQKDSSVQLYFYPDNFKNGFATAMEHQFHGITIAFDKITKTEVAQCKNVGIKVAVWNVQTSAENKKALNLLPDFIQSDRLRDLLDK